jgi:hypothetical protein
MISMKRFKELSPWQQRQRKIGQDFTKEICTNQLLRFSKRIKTQWTNSMN